MFHNVYADEDYANSYAGLEWSGTYHLVYRDLPGILGRHVIGRRALDFGCGTGRSTRLLRSYGFSVTGVDIAESMIRNARQVDPSGEYVLLENGDLSQFAAGSFDLVLAAFPFDNIPAPQKERCLRAIRKVLAPAGRAINIVSSPEIYTHEWASFSTRDFPQNQLARDGDVVRIVTTEFRGGKPAEDVLCTDEAYHHIYLASGLEVVEICKPLGKANEGVNWVSETHLAPWVIYVLAAKR
ncbi:MAG TPA: class I SAM-dependent methyltransferase [Terriglobales bacterium]|nr:class I SAM-dependent methyltransferase [Terriglobales bacterium]